MLSELDLKETIFAKEKNPLVWGEMKGMVK